MNTVLETQANRGAAARLSVRRSYRSSLRGILAQRLRHHDTRPDRERAGVTKGTIYVYFESKDTCSCSMCGSSPNDMETMQDMFKTHDGSTADLLRAQFSFIYEHLVEDRAAEVVRMLIAEATRFPELADRYHAEILRPCWTCSGRRSSAASIAAKSAIRRSSNSRRS